MCFRVDSGSGKYRGADTAVPAGCLSALAHFCPSCQGPSGPQRAVSRGLCPASATRGLQCGLPGDMSGLETGVTACRSLHGKPPESGPDCVYRPHGFHPATQMDTQVVTQSVGGGGAAPSVWLGGLNEMMRVWRGVRAPVTQ